MPPDNTAPAPMTQRKQRAMQIADREAELHRLQSDLARQRTGASRQGRALTATDEEQGIRAELRALTGERARLLEQVTQREVRLRERQGEQARNRAAITEKRGKKARQESAAEVYEGRTQATGRDERPGQRTRMAGRPPAVGPHGPNPKTRRRREPAGPATQSSSNCSSSSDALACPASAAAPEAGRGRAEGGEARP